MTAPSTNPNPPAPALAPRPAATPLLPILLFTFFNSMGTGIVTNGIYFLTDQTYGFSRTDNFALGVVLGITYVLAAWAAGPALRRLKSRLPTLSTRALLAWIMGAMALLSALPFLASFIPGFPVVWAVWALVILYSPLTGVLWPVVESFLSGGRQGPELRKAVGIWNVVWSSAIVAAYAAIAPFAESSGAEVIASLALVHLGCIAALLWFAREPQPHTHHTVHPGAHPEAHPEADGDVRPHAPPVYASLLAVFRILLPMSYLVLTALSPYLPTALRSMEVPTVWIAIVAATWLTARAIAFAALQRWGGWHGRWWFPVAASALLLTGFAAAVLAPQAGPAGLPILIAGLAVFGIAMASIYTGAIYYALAVGHAEVDAGGTHEALIGVGYTIGPAIGLAASAAVGAGMLRESLFAPLVLGTVGAVALLVALAAARAVSREVSTRRQRETSSP